MLATSAWEKEFIGDTDGIWENGINSHTDGIWESEISIDTDGAWNNEIDDTDNSDTVGTWKNEISRDTEGIKSFYSDIYEWTAETYSSLPENQILKKCIPMFATLKKNSYDVIFKITEDPHPFSVMEFEVTILNADRKVISEPRRIYYQNNDYIFIFSRAFENYEPIPEDKIIISCRIYYFKYGDDSGTA